MREKTTEKIAEKAGEFFTNGFHCAEAVVAAVAPTLHTLSEDEINFAIKSATPFGGGVGRSFEEMCGVISGANILIGITNGREKAGDDWELPAEISVQFRNAFLDRCIGTNCGKLRNHFGEKQESECKKLVMYGAEKIFQLLNK